MALAGFQIINKVLQDRDLGIVLRNGLDESYFYGFEDEFNFIVEHYKKYGNVPDTLSFLEKFPNFTTTEVLETDDYLIDKLDEEVGYQRFAKFFPLLSKKVQEDSRVGYDFLRENLENLKVNRKCNGTNIIKDADIRLKAYEEAQNNPLKRVIHTGFDELDECIDGFKYGDELVCVVARTSHGKSYFATKLGYEAINQGVTVGLYSGEMDANDIGYRFDTLNEHIPNSALKRGTLVQNYKEYIEKLSKEDKSFIIITQKEFGGKPTVQMIRNFIEQNKIQLMIIDQLSLMRDGRAGNNEQIRIKMAHITEDLFLLTSELKIPIVLLVQANREATKRDKTPPQLEDIKESDDISHNCSKVLSLARNGDELTIQVLKNRDGKSGHILKYYWDANNGFFEYIPSDNDGQNPIVKQQIIQKTKDEKINAVSKNPF